MLRCFGAGYTPDVLGRQPSVVAEQLCRSDGGTLLVQLYPRSSRAEAISRMRQVYTAKIAPLRGTKCAETFAVRGNLGDGIGDLTFVAGAPGESNPSSPLSALRPASRALTVSGAEPRESRGGTKAVLATHLCSLVSPWAVASHPPKPVRGLWRLAGDRIGLRCAGPG